MQPFADQICLTNDEVIFLSILLGSIEIRGFEIDDFSNRNPSQESFRKNWSITSSNLRKKGYIDSEDEESVQISEEVYEVIEAVTQAYCVVQIVFSRKAKKSNELCCFISERGIFIRQKEDKFFVFSKYDSISGMLNVINNCIDDFTDGIENAVSFSSAVINKAQYFELFGALNTLSQKGVESALTASGMDTEIASDCADAMLNRNNAISITCSKFVVRNDSELTDEITSELMFFFNKKHIYSIGVNGDSEETMSVSAINVNDCQSIIERHLKLKILY